MPLAVSWSRPLLHLPSVWWGWPGARVSLPGIGSHAPTGLGPCGQGSPLSGRGGRGGGMGSLPGGRPAGACMAAAAPPARHVAPWGVWQLPAVPRRGEGCRGRRAGVRVDALASFIVLRCVACSVLAQPSLCPPCEGTKVAFECNI